METFTTTLPQPFQDIIAESMLFAFLGFAVATLLTPVYTKLAYKYEWWKQARTTAVTGEKAKMYSKLHAKKHEANIPTMAGVIFVVSISIITLLLNLDRNQTWLPLSAMVGAGFVGLIDDVMNIRSVGGIAGLRAKTKSILIFIIGLIGGLWFYQKLGVDTLTIPFIDTPITIGWLIVPVFVFVLIATANAVNISDGLDGLAGGLSAIAFLTYAIIALLQGQSGIALFCMTIVGALLSYTWFNIYPARFFMGDSGSFALGTALAVVAMLTGTVLLLPIIGGVFVVEAGSSLVQILSKRLRNGKRVFKIAPIHHHFEASGWPETKVTMRFWLLGLMCSVVGLFVFAVDYL